MLKRKLAETINDSGGPENATTSNGQSESDDSNCSSGSTDALAPEVASGPSPPKRLKKKVNFKGVSVFYFPRRQGFTCVPSEGGSTLGMSEKHTFMRDFTISDYHKEQKRIHRAILAEQRRQGKMFPSPLLTSGLPSLDTEEDVSSGTESDSEYDDYYFLQPLPIRQRRVLLRTAGVKKIDNEEKDECRDIRISRNVCGCDCKLFCDPATCTCSLAGIQCQVDRLSFPCGCTKDGCSNPAGRIEFNPIRVRTHFIHTLMRLELERKDSHCPEGITAATTSLLSQRSAAAAAVGEIDVVGGAVFESEFEETESSKSFGDSVCAGASAPSDDTASMKVLKSRLKAKRSEAIDLNMFNSNERGSCRDCQNTDMCNVMMHDVKFSMVTQQQRQQQQRAISVALGPQPGYLASQGPQLQHHHHLGLSPSMLLLHPPPPQAQQQQPSSHDMLLFNDGEEDVYRAENTSSLYFDNDDNSYSEMSDTSPDVLESRSFSGVGPGNFQGKFHVSPSHMFTSGSTSGSNGVLHNETPGMPKQGQLLNANGLQILQGSNTCGGGLPPASCSSIGLEQQQQRPCELLPHPHPPHRSASPTPGQSLLRPPFLPRASQLSPGRCVVPAGTISPASGLLPQNGLLTCTQMSSSLELDVSDSIVILPGATSEFQNKFGHTDIMEMSSHAVHPYKTDSLLVTEKTYSLGSSAGTNTDYINQTSQINFSPSTVDFGNTTSSTNINDASASFHSLQTKQHQSCWSSSLSSPTLRDCFGLGSSSSVPGCTTSPSQGATKLEITCSSNYQQEPQSSSVTLSPASPNAASATYATMTTTTRDRLAAHCPGISSHMDGRSELATSKDTTPTFSSYAMTTEDSDTSSLVGTSQNLLYDLPYPASTTMKPSPALAVSCPTEEERKSTNSLIDNFSNETLLSSLSETSFSHTLSSMPPSTSSLSSELSDTSLIYSTEVQSSCLPSVSSKILSSPLTPPTSFTLPSEMCPAASAAHPSFTHESPAALLPDSSVLHNSHNFSKESYFDSHRNSSDSQLNGISTPTEELKGTAETLNEIPITQNLQSTLEYRNLSEADLGSWDNTKYDLKEHKNISSWDNEDKGHMNGTCCVKLSSERPGAETDQERGYQTCAADSEVASSASSSVVQSATSSSSSSPTMSEDDKEHNVSQNFGEIIKESIVEMVLV